MALPARSLPSSTPRSFATMYSTRSSSQIHGFLDLPVTSAREKISCSLS